MKKLLSILVAALFCTSLSAQKLSESFEGSTFPPEGWTSNPTTGWKRMSKADSETLNVFDGTACAVVRGAYQGNSYLFTPQLRPAAGEKLHFAARIQQFGGGGWLKVEVSVNGTETNSFTAIASYSTSSTGNNHLRKDDWQEYELDLSQYVNQRIYVAFHMDGDTEGFVYLDAVSGVTLAGSATCDAPTNLQISNATAESVTITWEGDAEAYEYYLALNGQAPDWSEAGQINAKQIELTDLYEDQAYDFYVRAYCSEQEQSLAPSVSFNTSCTPAVIPWLETFSRDATGVVEPECWVVSSPGTHQVWVVADKEYDDEGNAQTIYGQAHLFASGGGDRPQVFALPAFDAQLNTLEIAFDYKTSQVGENYGKLEIGYMTNAADANTFVSLKTFDQTLTYVRETYSLAALPAAAKFIAFRYAGGTSYLCGVSMDNFVVAEIGHSQEIDPADEELPDASIWALTYCEAQFTWYAYNVEAFGIALFDAESQDMIAGVLVTTSECERFAQTDEIAFSEYDDYENHYYCSTKWILNVDEDAMQRGIAWSKCVRNIGSLTSPQLGLNAGKYRVSIYKYTSGSTSLGDLIQSIDFELTEKKVENLKAEVASDKKTATLTWEAPELGASERLYVRVWSGETVAYDNFEDSRVKPTSPLTVNVTEGRAYSAIVQVIDKHGNALGPEVATEFTVGVNNYEPKNLHAEVFGGDNVTFTWEAEEEADAYEIALYWEGEFYARLTVHGFTKTSTTPKDGTWSWTVQAFTIGSNGNYFEASKPIKGNDFETKGVEVPEDAIEQNVWLMEAAPFELDPSDPDYREGKYVWIIVFGTGEENGSGRPAPWFTIYSDREAAISGVYTTARGNLAMGEQVTFMDTNGTLSGLKTATNAELRLTFDGFDEDYMEQGFYFAHYTGRYIMTCDDGKTYTASFFELFCNSQTYNSMVGQSSYEYVGMYGETNETPVDPVDPEDSVEKVLTEHGFDLTRPMFNVMGQQVDATYKGIVIQDGKKFMLQ